MVSAEEEPASVNETSAKTATSVTFQTFAVAVAEAVPPPAASAAPAVVVWWTETDLVTDVAPNGSEYNTLQLNAVPHRQVKVTFVSLLDVTEGAARPDERIVINLPVVFELAGPTSALTEKSSPTTSTDQRGATP